MLARASDEDRRPGSFESAIKIGLFRPYEFTRPIPKLLRQALSVRNGLVKVYWRHMETVPFPDRKDLAKFYPVQAARHDLCDKPGLFCHVDVSAHYFVCKVAQNRRRGIHITSDPY